MNPDFAGLRTKMVDGQLRTTDVTDTRVLDAMGIVPREHFVDSARVSLAYLDEDLPLGSGRFLMEPSPLAKLLQLADPRAGDRMLIVGCTTGYSAAVAAMLAREVVALESEPALAEKARTALASVAASNVSVVEGRLTDGYPAAGPYDVILVEGAVEVVPQALLDQLAEGGRLVAVEGAGNAGVARLTTMNGGATGIRRGFNAAVKPLPGFEKRAEFQF